jgi:hypothetical protein
MTETNDKNVDYGPLAGLIGTWQGDKGMDVAPERDGSEESLYHETITFQAIGDVENAESQRLAAIHYRQIVRRKSNDEIFHDQTGYWMWDARAGVVIHSLLIPRAVGILAGGTWDESKRNEDGVILELRAKHDDRTGRSSSRRSCETMPGHSSFATRPL